MLNRQMRSSRNRRCSYRKRGGGFSVQDPLVPQPSGPGSDFTFAIKQPINRPYSDCTFAQRPGQLDNIPNPALAQTVMAGGSCGCSAPRWGGSRRRGRKNRRNGRKTQRGSSYGYAVDPSVSVGGDGPNVAPLHAPIPCDARAGSPNMFNPVMGAPDPRAPADLYSLTPNQTGGAATLSPYEYGVGNAFGPDCYRATGSQMPVYNASVAGFNFSPSTAAGATLPDGVTAFNEVNPVAARTGGGRRRSRKNRNRKASRKNRKSRKVGGRMFFCPPDMRAPGPNGKCEDGSEPMSNGPNNY